MPTIPGYTELVEIGRGGFATVYRARQEAFDRTVAIKVVTAAGADERGLERFLRECRAAGSLSWHPGVVTVYDAGETAEGDPYLVMEHLEGGAVAEASPLSWREAVEIGIAVADALQAAHDARLIHRDVKPENILLGRNSRPMLADFGIAALEEGESLTRTGQVTASVRHAPPEVLDGKGAQRASDIWSLASTIHALIRGQAPFMTGVDDTLLPLISRIAREDPPDLTPFGVTEPVQAVLRRAMAKDPAERWASAATFADALRQALDPTTQMRVTVVAEDNAVRPPGGEPPVSRPGARQHGGPEGRPVWRNPVVLGLLLLAVIVAAGIGVAAGRGGEEGAAASGPATASTSEAVDTASGTGVPDAAEDAGAPADDERSEADVPQPPSEPDVPPLRAALAAATPLPPARTPGATPAVVTEGDGLQALETRIAGPMDVVIDPDGRVTLAVPGEQRVRRIEPDGTIATVAGTGVGCDLENRGINVPAVEAILCQPERLAIAPDGTLLIADAFHPLVRRVDGAGVISDVAGTAPGSPYSAIGGLAVRDGQLWVTDFEQRVVYVGAGPMARRAAGGFVEPRGVALHPLRDSILIADAGGRIVEVTDDATSTFIGRDTPTAPRPDDPIANPWDVDVDPLGRVWIADPGTFTVRYMDPGGTLFTIPHDFSNPIGVASHPDGSTWVVDGEEGAVYRILPDLVTVEQVAGIG